jgi:DNA-binding NtrC family response regulator
VEGILRSTEIEIILLDLMMPFVSGEEILSRVVESCPHIPVIIVTGVNELDTAVQCMKNGAFDYVLKPVEESRLIPSIRRALEIRRLRRENSRLASGFFSEKLTHPEVFKHIITRNSKMQAIFRYCEAVAEGQQPILITGETGVGKEFIAKALHELSNRKGPLVAVNVSGLDDQVFSDTLFGHVRGAFTGADRPRSGLAEKARGGTLFLDEIGDLKETTQIKLLRFLEEREYYPLGSDSPKSSDARVIVATHQNLDSLQEQEIFRKDLYYRLRTHWIQIPPLRERKEDIPLLLDHFLLQAAQEFNKRKPAYSEGLIGLLQEYHYPGNIRELRSLIFDAVSSHKSPLLSLQSFQAVMSGGGKKTTRIGRERRHSPVNSWASQLDAIPTIKDATSTLIEEALRRSGNNQRLAAIMLGITPQALNQRLKRQSPS